MKKSNYSVFYKDIRKFGVEYAIRHTVKMGFDSVELFDTSSPTRWLRDRRTVFDLKEKLLEKQLSISCYSVAVNLLSEDIDGVMERTLEHVDNAAEIGAPYFHHTLVPGLDFTKDIPEYNDALRKVIDNAQKIAERCNERGIVCLYEPQGARFNGVCGLGTLLEEVRRRGCDVGICGDMGNSLFVDCEPSKIFKAFAPDIKHIHVKDYLVRDKAEEKAFVSVGGKYLVPVAIGDGNADIKKCFSFLKNYNGVVSFEITAGDEEMQVCVNRVERCFYERKDF